MILRDTNPSLQDLQYMSYSEDGTTVHFRLMERIKPRLTGLAIALGFPQHIIDDLETKRDPVYHLFKEWLNGGNQEHDSRPLTWGTLITALQHAGLLEEVRILEQHFVAAQQPVADERGAAIGVRADQHNIPIASRHQTNEDRIVQTDDSGPPPADSSTILFKLERHRFPAYKWLNLATGLMMGGSVPKYYGLQNDLARLNALVTDWTASAVDEAGRWENLVTAVNMSGEKVVAQKLTKELGIPPPVY